MSSRKRFSASSVLYISHGGGPLPFLGDESHKELIDNLKKIASIISEPSAIIVVSAHWENDRPTITSGAHPSLVYDYSGFPREAYEIEYPAPGNPSLARQLFDLLKHNGMEAKLDGQRGFDHGLFIPLKIMYPHGDIPCIQLSLLNSLSPVDHIRMGEALTGLTENNILVIGSGFSFHNMRAFFSAPTDDVQSMNASFEQWLIETCSSQELSEAHREQKLVDWESAPAARFCHPREEHLLPLHVCYGAVKSPARQVFTFEVMGKKASAYLW